MWNYSGGVIYTESLKTLPTIAAEITAFGGAARTGVSSAIVFLLLIPPMVLFVIMQSKVVQTMSHSGIK
jgi:ABC-type glycerol-3-phosphate transport system permease component